jgi:hypothetical protein
MPFVPHVADSGAVHSARYPTVWTIAGSPGAVSVNDSHCPVHRTGSIALLVILLLFLTGCGGGDEGEDPSLTPDASATAAALILAAGSSPTPTSIPAPSYGDVVWTEAVDSSTKEPTSPVEAFSTDAQTIYAAILVQHVPTNTVLTADWTYNATSLDGLTTSANLVSGAQNAWVEFHLTRSDDHWPDGTYAISITVAGEVVATADVEVDDR